MWEPKNDSQPGHIVPPMLNLTSGPSGLAYYPGTGFSLGCKDQFLICDYRGGAAASGIWKFSIKDDGAGFAVDNSGNMVANNASMTGQVTATGGSIGGWTINGTQLIGSGSAGRIIF